MAKVLFRDAEGNRCYTETNDKHEPVANFTGLPSTVYHRASEVYLERSDGNFKCLKNRFGELRWMDSTEAMMWVLSAKFYKQGEM